MYFPLVGIVSVYKFLHSIHVAPIKTLFPSHLSNLSLSSNLSSYTHYVTELMSAAKMDAHMQQMESGVELALERAKVWSKYAKDVITYIEKRTMLGKSVSAILYHHRWCYQTCRRLSNILQYYTNLCYRSRLCEGIIKVSPGQSSCHHGKCKTILHPTAIRQSRCSQCFF